MFSWNALPPLLSHTHTQKKKLMKVVIFSDWLSASRIRIQRSFLIFLILVLSKIDRPLVWFICCLQNCSLGSGWGGKIRNS